MKTTKYLFFLSLTAILFLCNGYVYATSLTTLKGTKWYLERMTEQDTSASSKITSKLFKQGAQQISFEADGKYDARNLLGLDSLTGFFIETNNTLVLSNEAGNAYYWVFEFENKTTDSLTLQFINYSTQSSIIKLTFKPMTKQLEEMVLSQNNPPKYANFEGNWEWNFDGKILKISLSQAGDGLVGTHCYGVDCQYNYNLIGTIEENIATLQVKTRSKNPVILGVAKAIRLPDGTLKWILDKNDNNKIKTAENILLNKSKVVEEEKIEDTKKL